MSYEKDPLLPSQLLSSTVQPLQSSISKPEKPSYLPAISKVSVVIFRKRLYIGSISDRYQYLRMLIFGFLMKAHTDPNHRDLIEMIQRVVGSGVSLEGGDSKLSKVVKRIGEITSDKGVDTEKEVIELFVEATDTLIINSFAEFMEQEGSDYFRMNDCKTWFESKFGEKVRILDNYQSNTSGITFVKDGNKILYQSQNDIDNVEGVSLSSNLLTKSELMGNLSKTDPQQRDNDILELSIMKPSLHNVSESIHSPGIRHKLSVDSNFSPKPSPFDDEDFNRQSKKKKEKEKGFDIWDYLCC